MVWASKAERSNTASTRAGEVHRGKDFDEAMHLQEEGEVVVTGAPAEATTVFPPLIPPSVSTGGSGGGGMRLVSPSLMVPVQLTPEQLHLHAAYHRGEDRKSVV